MLFLHAICDLKSSLGNLKKCAIVKGSGGRGRKEGGRGRKVEGGRGWKERGKEGVKWRMKG